MADKASSRILMDTALLPAVLATAAAMLATALPLPAAGATEAEVATEVEVRATRRRNQEHMGPTSDIRYVFRYVKACA